ncbi:MAG: GTPase domain-containing protein [Minicystis sp.]
MSFFNAFSRELFCKIVYYGPGLCGKTTNVERLHQRAQPHLRGNLVSLKTESERTLFFDFLPLDLGLIRGFKVRLQLYTVPGQVFYRASRRLILKGADAVVFVADSQSARLEANVESMLDLRENLSDLKIPLESLSCVIQYNKRDLEDIEPVERLRALLNPMGAPEVEGAAASGVGVAETLHAAAKQVLRRLAA